MKTDIKKVSNACNVKADKLEDYLTNVVNETKDNIKKDVAERIKRIQFDIEENVVNLKDENGKQIATSENLKGISQH